MARKVAGVCCQLYDAELEKPDPVEFTSGFWRDFAGRQRDAGAGDEEIAILENEFIAETARLMRAKGIVP